MFKFFNIFLLLIFIVSNIGNAKNIIIKVKKGNTLWAISAKYLKNANNWRKIAKINNIKNPRYLKPGTKIIIPEVLTDDLMSLTEKSNETGVKMSSSVKTEIPKKEFNFSKEIKQFEDKLNTLIANDKTITSQKKYFSALNSIEEAKKALENNDKEIAEDLIKKAKSLFEKIIVNKTLENIKIKTSKIIFIKGRVDVFNQKEKSWITVLRNNVVLYNQDKIKTGENSTATISFEDGSNVMLLPNSEISILRTVYDTKKNTLYSKIKLNAGTVYYNTRDNIPLKVVNEVSTTDANIEFSGHLNVTLLPDDTIRYELYYGKGMVYAFNEQQALSSGYGVYVFPGVSPGKPKKLLYPVNLDSPPNNVFSKNPKPLLKWKKTIGATKYKVQISTNDFFYGLVYEAETKENNLEVTALLDGDYFWRVIPIDEKGFEGFFSKIRMFRVDSIAPRLAVLSPLDDEVIHKQYVTFKGITEPNHNVQINQYTVVPDKNGEFTYSLPLTQGTNLVRVAVKDQAGNVTEKTKIIHVDYNLQLIVKNKTAYSLIPEWAFHSYNAEGQIILNNLFYETKLGDWNKPLKFQKGKNILSLNLGTAGYREFKFVFDNDNPVLKSLKIDPVVREDEVYLNVTLKAFDASSPLSKIAEIIIKDSENRNKMYQTNLVYNNNLNEYQGIIKINANELKRKMILSYLKVTDVVGNKTELDEKSIEQPNSPTPFWDKIKTNYKQMGLPVFVLTGGGILFTL